MALATENLRYTTMYVTHAPCLECSKYIVNVGIIRVVYADEYRSKEGVDLLAKAGILIQRF